MPTELQTILDDYSLVDIGNKNWTTHSKVVGYYGGSARYARVPQSSFDFWFDGTSVALFGLLPGPPTQRPVATIDGEMWNVSNDHPVTVYRKWFQSPTLVDGIHKVSVANCSNGTVIDYAIVNVGTHADLSVSEVIVDNESPSIVYSGQWSRNTGVVNSVLDGIAYSEYPYGNSTHQSSTPGDTFTFRFTGTSVSVYGSFTWEPGVLDATFTLDNDTEPRNSEIIQTKGYPQETPNYLHYSRGNLSSGDHTLIVNITMAVNYAFVLDYITYKPSFQSLLSPLLNNTTATTPTATTFVSINSSTPSGSSPPQGAPRSLPTVAIIGGVTGVLVVVILAILGRWLFLRWRKAKQTDDLSPYLHHRPDNETNFNQHIPTKERQHIPQLQPLRQGPQPMKFMQQATDSNMNIRE